MPPKQQKKKATKKLVNRGFATTSIPKKVHEPEPTDLAPSGDPSSENNVTPASLPASVIAVSGLKSSDPNQSTFTQECPPNDEWEQDPDEREIQSLAERLRPVAEKEITKQLKIIENEKRFTKGWSGFQWLGSRLQNEILDFARDVQTTIGISGSKQSHATSNTCLQEDEEKTLQKLATLHGILEGMNFPKARIKQCLERIRSLEVEEAIDYLVLICSNEELTLAGFEGLISEDSTPGIVDKESNIQNQNLVSLSALNLNDGSPGTKDEANNKTSAFRDLGNSTSEIYSDLPALPKDLSFRIENPGNSQPPAEIGFNCPSPTIKNITLERQQQLESEASSSAGDLPNTIDDYVTLKLSIIELSKKIPKAGTAHLKGKALKDSAKAKKEVKVFEEKVKLLQASYAFNQKKADQALKAKLKEIKEIRLVGSVGADESLEQGQEGSAQQGPTPPSPPLPITAMQSSDNDVDELETTEHDISVSNFDHQHDAEGIRNLEPASPIHSQASNPVDGVSAHEGLGAGSENNDDELGLFGSTFEESHPMADQTGTSLETKKPLLVMRDMPLPKPFIGKTPQNLLEETLRRLDKFAQPQYLIISKGSRAVRASVAIKWSNRKLIPTHTGEIRATSSKLNVNPIQTFTMEDEACRDETQAYNYVATLALFHLNVQNFPTVHRSLPATFRELWGELEEKHKKQDDEKYLHLLKSLMEIAKNRSNNILCQSTSKRTKELHPRPFNDKNLLPSSHSSHTERGMGNMALMEEFAMRQHWPSYQTMLGYRATLPIAVYRSLITTAVDQNQVILLCGETGCGKSTQLPAFILEHELANNRPVKIFCTQPRRISAISLAERVSQELGEPSGAVGQVGSLVGYSIRLESRTSSTSRLIYATTGVVLRMLENATDLQEITHLILDEIHERSIDSDFLLIALKTILERRPNLRVILMSATVDAEKISNYMNGCPILKVPGRTFPVTSFFLEDVIELTDYKLNAQSDSPYLARRGKRKPVMLKTTSSTNEEIPSLDDEEETITDNNIAQTYAPSTRDTLEFLDENLINMDLIVLLLMQVCWYNTTLAQRFSSAILIFLPSLDSIRKLTEVLESHSYFGTSSFQIFPLHSSISNENQSLVFQKPPAGVRKIVIATNIAETGITIPDVTCVIDSGKHKEMRYDEKRQISKLVETFIAKSNVTQRRGRAGRVQEGICFHLFTKHRFDTLPDNPLPEMLRLSLQDLALRIKIMQIGTSIEEVLLQALDPPSTANVQRAIASLVEVKALTLNEDITPLGRHLVKLPMDVHMGKLLILGCLFRCLSPALTVAAALNSKSPFLNTFGRELEADSVKKSFKVENSDFLTICKVHNSWRDACQNDYVHKFCRKNMLSFPNLLQIEELRLQFFGFLVDAGFVNVNLARLNSRSKFCPVPSELDVNADQNKIVMGCIGAAMFPKLLIREGAMQIGNVNSNAQGGWRTLTNSAPASIHPSSVNYSSGRRPDFGDAKFLTYFNIMQSKKLYIWESGVVDEQAVFLLCGEADCKIPAQSVIIDRKIKAWMNPKTLLTIKILRQQFQQLFNLKMKNPSHSFNEQQQRWFDMITAAINDDKGKMAEASAGAQNPTTPQSNINVTINNKGRMSVAPAPACRITFSHHNNIHAAVEPTPNDSRSSEVSQSVPSETKNQVSNVDVSEHDQRTTFYQTTRSLPTQPSPISTTTATITNPTLDAGSVHTHTSNSNIDNHHLGPKYSS